MLTKEELSKHPFLTSNNSSLNKVENNLPNFNSGSKTSNLNYPSTTSVDEHMESYESGTNRIDSETISHPDSEIHDSDSLINNNSCNLNVGLMKSNLQNNGLQYGMYPNTLAHYNEYLNNCQFVPVQQLTLSERMKLKKRKN